MGRQLLGIAVSDQCRDSDQAAIARQQFGSLPDVSEEDRVLDGRVALSGRSRGPAMSEWTSDELSKIETAEELKIESVRGDGTLRRPVTIWVVRDGGHLYVRSVNGRSGAWFRGTQTRHQGRIRAGGVAKDVSFVSISPSEEVGEKIDAAYRAKYRRYPASIVNTVLSAEARAATLELVPNDQ